MTQYDPAKEVMAGLFREWGSLCGIAPDEVAPCILAPDNFYCVYPIHRGRKVRWIEAPKVTLKRVQRTLLDHVLYKLRATEHAHGFVPGRSIVTNAQRHVGKQWVVTLDIKNFFPSITSRQVATAIAPLGLDQSQLHVLARLLSRRGRLPQGAPTSPHVANLVAADMDHRLAALTARRGWSYSRYADDLTFSGDSPPVGLVDEVKAVLRDNGFRVAPGKTHVTQRHQRQIVTGLVVNDRVRLPKPGRRLIRAMLHRAASESLVTIGVDPVLQGHLAFAAFVSQTVLSWELSQLGLISAGDAVPEKANKELVGRGSDQ